MSDNEEILPLLPLARYIGQRQYVGPGRRYQLCLYNDQHYVVVDELNRQVKEYVTNNNGVTYFIDWDSNVDPVVVDAIFKQYVQEPSQ